METKIEEMEELIDFSKVQLLKLKSAKHNLIVLTTGKNFTDYSFEAVVLTEISDRKIGEITDGFAPENFRKFKGRLILTN